MNLCYIQVLETLKHEPLPYLELSKTFFVALFEDSRRCHSLRAWGRWECQPVNTAASCIFNHKMRPLKKWITDYSMMDCV